MIEIRDAQLEDAKELLAIYRPYVEETAITFETEVPSLAEFKQRIETTQKQFPYLVAEIDDNIVGYAYAHEYYGRAAYAWTVEVSIYVDKTARSSGVGTALYDCLEAALQKQGIINFLACISLPNEPSICFHRKRGYQQVAHFDRVGFKFDTWHDIVWLQKRVQESELPKPPTCKSN